MFESINQFAFRFLWLDTLAIFFAEYFGYFLIFILLLFLVKDRKKYWLMVSQSFLAALFSRFVVTQIIRWLWQRPRPFVENNVHLLVDEFNQASFPSGHASFFFALAAAVYFHDKKTGTLFLLAAFLISLARVFAGVHWPLDIIAGAVVGVLSAWLTCKLFKDK